MSDTPDTTLASSNAETQAALARLAAFNKSSKTGTPDSGGAGALMLGLIFVVLLVATGGLAWLQFAQMNELTALRNDYTELQQLNAGSTNRFAVLQEGQDALGETLQQALQQELGAANTALAVQAGQLATLASELAGTRLRVNSMDAGGSPLTEAGVLLRFAQQRLLLARDTVTAISLFQSADELLRAIDDPQIFTVREALARDLAQLQALPVVDVPGLFAQLSAQAAQVANFDVVAVASAQDFTVTPVSEEGEDNSGWWSGILQSLSGYFVVTHSAGAVTPQLDADEQFMIRALIQLHIEQAKLALLRSESQLYQAALDDALAASRQWLRSDDGSFDEFVTALDTLRNTQVVTEIPAIDQTLTALRQLPGAAALALPATPPDPEPIPDAVEAEVETAVETGAARPEAQQ